MTRQIPLAALPGGRVEESGFALQERSTADTAPGGLLTGKRNYVAPLPAGAPVRSHAMGELVFPDGVDCCFDNAGGESGDAVFTRLNVRARVAVRGQIARSEAVVPR